MPLGFPVVPDVYRMYKQVFAVHRLGRALGRLARRPRRATRCRGRPASRTSFSVRLKHEHVLDRRRLGERLIGDVLQVDDRAAPPRAVGSDEHLRLGVIDAILQRLRSETAENHGVRRTDARAREHRGNRLGHHAHVDRDAVTLFDTQLAQQIRDAAGFVEQLSVRDRAGVAGLAFPVVRDLARRGRRARVGRDNSR